MLYKDLHRTKRTRHRRLLANQHNMLKLKLHYKLKNRAGRSHKGHITIHYRKRHTNSWRIELTRLPYILLPGIIVKFIAVTERGCLRAYVKTFVGRYIVIPAVRGMIIGQSININNSIGSFIKPKKLPQKQMFCNVITMNTEKPKLLCSPGTYAKQLRRNEIILPRQRIIWNVIARYVQLGINAGHDWKRTVIGNAGHAYHLGHRPRVRTKAKNPCSRMPKQTLFRKTTKSLPWR